MLWGTFPNRLTYAEIRGHLGLQMIISDINRGWLFAREYEKRKGKIYDRIFTGGQIYSILFTMLVVLYMSFEQTRMTRYIK